MLKTRIDWGVGTFAAGRIDQQNGGPYRSVTPCVGRVARFRILRRKQVAPGTGTRKRLTAWSRCPGNDELMSRKAGPLISLEHAVGERVLLGQSEVGLNVGWIDVHELRVGMRVGRAIGVWRASDQVRPIHFATVVHGNEGSVGVVQVVILRVGTVCAQGDGAERNGLTQRVHAVFGNVRAPADQHLILKKVIRSAVLLEDHHHVLNLSWRRRSSRTATGTATAVEAHESAFPWPTTRLRTR